MLQASKVEKSRKDWRGKAIQRGNENRELRKSQTCHRKRIAELKKQNRELIQGNATKKIAELEKQNCDLKQTNEDLKKKRLNNHSN